MQYSQLRAMLSITRASLTAIFRSPSAIVFSFAFPFVFILVFGFLGNASMIKYKIVIDQYSNKDNLLYKQLQLNPSLKLVSYKTNQQLQEALRTGSVAAIINISKNSLAEAPFAISMKCSSAANDQWPQVKSIIESVINDINNKMYPKRLTYASFDFNSEIDVQQVREYKTIDFILPGQLGFSLLSAGVFGVAFMFFNLRNTMVLKRFFATPIRRTYIILGEGFSRILFQMITSVVILLVGHFCFGFTLINGVQTFFELLLLSFIGLMVFMGFGFIVSGLAKNDSTIPPLANLITMPQFLLGGTFFSVDNFPKWLQPISKFMPLTHLNNAMREVAFDGRSLWDVKTEIGILLLFAVIVYAIAVKVFKWE